MSSSLSNLELFHDPSYPTLSGRFRSMRPKVLVHRLNRSWKLSKKVKEITRAGKLKREMQVKNMKLYVMNKIIVEENERLRRKAMTLLQENKILLAQFQKFPHPDSNTIKY
ncbi:unnamed protein product [Coffea canephora]|uniref:Protein LITTLE ZIPPER 1-like n=1 Tax=Coffea canephora TaxID=49390 RepID=A0A068VDN1_COFCA|nr:unnamed protein product [Coffea canephora]